MGSALSRHLARLGFGVVVHNRTISRAQAVAAQAEPGQCIIAAPTRTTLAEQLPRPRIVLVLVAPGATELVLDDLRTCLDPDDVIVDAGNADFTDTQRRQDLLRASQIELLGAGVASGVDGALSGISATISGSRPAYELLSPLMTAAGASISGQTCCVYVGSGGSGHFVKTLHNGVEYSIMQLLAETITLSATRRNPRRRNSPGHFRPGTRQRSSPTSSRSP